MKIWLLEDGERTGPHEVYTVRDMISNEEVNADTPAWYEGADGWVTLADVPAYSSDFSKSKKTDEEDGGVSSLNKDEFVKKLESQFQEQRHFGQAQPNSAQFQNEPLYPIRRLCARAIDFVFYMLVVIIVKAQLGINPFEAPNDLRELLFLVPYVLLDGLALAYLGTTPGKWLLNIKLRSASGQKLKVDISIIRSLRVWVLGFAMHTFLIYISLPLSWFFASKYGKFLWDIPRNNITECKRINPLKLVLLFIMMMAMGALLENTLPPEYLKIAENYEWKFF